MQTLANKYRPTKFEDVVGQPINREVLQKQIDNNSYSHAILFAGNAGCGKTTCARIFANMIDGEILEYDCASHNGVSDIREIIAEARVQSLINEYKVFILDECHTLSSAAWPALLITLEENLPKSIFILCTTNTEKIPDTIMSRVQRFNFSPITRTTIIDRLKYVCQEENITVNDDALDCISKTANGNMRQALTNLDKCILYGDLSLDGVQRVLNVISDNIFDDLYKAIESSNINDITNIINNIYLEGYELHFVIRQFLDYLLIIKGDLKIIDTTLTLINEIRYDNSPRTLIIARYICCDIQK